MKNTIGSSQAGPNDRLTTVSSLGAAAAHVEASNDDDDSLVSFELHEMTSRQEDNRRDDLDRSSPIIFTDLEPVYVS